MRAGVMSAGLFGITGTTEAVKEREPIPAVVGGPRGWNQDSFATQQIRTLVRQVFQADTIPEIRQVVFSAVDRDTDVSDICQRLGQALASETGKEVVVVTSENQTVHGGPIRMPYGRRDAVHVGGNLWRLVVPRSATSDQSRETLGLLMQNVRREFGFSIFAGSVGTGLECSRMAEFADGLVLVISALRTRRAAARKMLDDLRGARLLGTVLQDREFPVPEKIYRRL